MKGALQRRGWVRSRKLLGPYCFLELELDPPLQEFQWGQFALVEAPGCLLMRPMSLFSSGRGRVSFLFCLVGRGTRALASTPCGEGLRVLLPLGRGFPPPEGDGVVLVAGGVGIAPLHPWAMELSRRGHTVTLFWGAKDASWFPPSLIDPLLGAEVMTVIATEDGSLGHKGVVTELLESLPPAGGTYYACGPSGMIRAAVEAFGKMGLKGFVSVEERMACGVGACLGCAVETVHGHRFVCRDGPVFQGEELLWDRNSG